MTQNNNITTTNIGDYAKKSYLSYAMSVVLSRSIPNVEDGLKPVQRRILYTMKMLGLWHNSSFMKSARVVGEVMGKYHPHGDSSIYDAMTRMSQDFQLRYPLVHGQGNWGSRGGDSAAAMRYTEAKLTPIAEAFLNELSWDTVDFIPNYDGSHKEPKNLPARLPFVLLNGASGVAVGLATDLPSHNITEVVNAAITLIKNPKTTFDEILDIVSGPDFPTGGQIITSPDEIRKIYKEGNGSIRIRSRWKVEYEPNGKDWKLVFHELPQGSSAEKIMLKIEEMMVVKETKEKDKKKKQGVDKSLVLKRLFNDMIESYQDYSDKNGIALTFFPKSRRQNPDELALLLCSHTDLELSYKVNFVAVDDTGSPHKDTFYTWLNQWCNFRIHTLVRLFTDQLNRILRRLHIIAGRLIILADIRDVVELITTADNPKESLMAKYKLDEIQADDVLSIQLKSLAKMEKISLEAERDKHEKEKNRLEKILSTDKNVRKEVIKELESDLKKFGDERRTLIKYAETANNQSTTLEERIQNKVSNEMIAVAITERGWLSWKSAKVISSVQDSDFKLKAGDTIRRTYLGNKSETLFLLDQQGKGYSINLNDLIGKADTQPFTTWIEPTTKIVEGIIGKSEDSFLLAGQKGYGFITQGSNWVASKKAGKSFLTLTEEESPLIPVKLPQEIKDLSVIPDDYLIVALSSDEKLLAFKLNEMKVITKGKGVGIMSLQKDMKMSDVALVKTNETVMLLGNKRNLELKEKDFSKLLSSRAKKGKILNKQDSWIGFEKTIIVKTDNNGAEGDDEDI